MGSVTLICIRSISKLSSGTHCLPQLFFQNNDLLSLIFQSCAFNIQLRLKMNLHWKHENILFFFSFFATLFFKNKNITDASTVKKMKQLDGCSFYWHTWFHSFFFGHFLPSSFSLISLWFVCLCHQCCWEFQMLVQSKLRDLGRVIFSQCVFHSTCELFSWFSSHPTSTYFSAVCTWKWLF